MMGFRKIVLITMVAVGFALHSHGQEMKPQDTSKKEILPYLKYPEMPAFNIRLQDSVTIFNTFNIPPGRCTMLILFDPDCKHCKAEATRITRAMDSLQNIDFYFMSASPFMDKIRTFYKEFNMAKYPNIKVVGRDYEFFFFGYYGAKFIPAMALYDPNKNFVKLYDGSVTPEQLWNETHRKHK